ncbi:carbohydrate kinase family protein [Herbaspirillum huttiense]|uniref:Carbohydrate kinase family protein n=2 Tax=Herbaspirillum huttiense TaxID=863372 RepID=A0AAJ2HB40_9BURK|nr:carbohydrate kinase family protein [Herbaspirillum huttiense]MDR9838823.1 carbohydrate kinase family protein [Herbaspirillum huttiense]
MSSRPYDLLTLGDPVADLMLRAEQLPPPGGKTVGQWLGVLPGGTTANVACAASRLGMHCAQFGRVGDDPHAQLLRDSLGEYGVATQWLTVQQQAASASAVAILAPSGEKSIIYLPMAAATLDTDALQTALRQSRLVYAMPYDLAELETVSHLARATGTLVAIDLEAAVAPNADEMWRRASLADIVFFNEAGFHKATGCAPSAQVLTEALRLGPSEIIVTLGAGGAIGAVRTSSSRHAAFPAQVVDTTGAGDCFNAAYLSARLRGQPLSLALRFACAAASCVVSALGARHGLPDQGSVAAILAATACTGATS